MLGQAPWTGLRGGQDHQSPPLAHLPTHIPGASQGRGPLASWAYPGHCLRKSLETDTMLVHSQNVLSPFGFGLQQPGSGNRVTEKGPALWHWSVTGIFFLLATPGMNCAEGWVRGLHPSRLGGHLALVTKPVA